MVRAYRRTMASYAAFSGRTGRSEFWLFVLAQSLIVAGGLVLAATHDTAAALLALYVLATLIPALAATVRRLHDTNQGLWWLALGVGLALAALALGAAGAQFTGVGFVLWVFVSAVERDTQGTAAEFESLFELGVTLLGLSVIAGLAAAALGLVLLVYLASAGTRGNNRYGPQPD